MEVAAGKWNVIGHTWAVEFLHHALVRERLAHAYLLAGPPQVGKRTLALELARAIECSGAPAPCGACRSCRLALAGAHPDIITIRGEGKGGGLLVDQVKPLRQEAFLSPVEGRYRIYIITGMELANESAANALLKTLEEPPAHVIFLLTATAAQLVSPTILSRSQVIALRAESQNTITQALVADWNVEPAQAELLARLSGGRFGRAVQAMRSPDLLSRRSGALEQLRAVLAGDRYQRFAVAGKLARRQDLLTETLETWLSWWRDVLLIEQNLADRIVNLDCRPELTEWQGLLGPGAAPAAMAATQACAEHVAKNVNTQLALEWLMLHLPWPVTQSAIKV